MRTYYWDSSVFVAYFNDEPNRADVVEELLLAAESGEILIITSSFAEVEVLKLDGHLPLTEKEEATLSAFFEYPFIKFVDANRQNCKNARHLIWKFTSLKPKDSVHLASALAFVERESLDGLFSYDKDFTRLNGKITTKFPISEPFVESPKLKLEPRQEEPEDKPAAPNGVTLATNPPPPLLPESVSVPIPPKT